MVLRISGGVDFPTFHAEPKSAKTPNSLSLGTGVDFPTHFEYSMVPVHYVYAGPWTGESQFRVKKLVSTTMSTKQPGCLFTSAWYLEDNPFEDGASLHLVLVKPMTGCVLNHPNTGERIITSCRKIRKRSWVTFFLCGNMLRQKWTIAARYKTRKLINLQHSSCWLRWEPSVLNCLHMDEKHWELCQRLL